MSRRANQKQSRLLRLKKPLIIAGVILILGAGAVFAYSNHKDAGKSTTPPTTKKEPLTVVATPPTEQDKKAVDEHKDTLVQQNKDGSLTPPATTTPSGKKQVSVVLVNASGDSTKNTITGGGYVSGVFEDGGTCTLTVTKGTEQHAGTSKGFATSSYTNCPPITVPGVSGTGWSAVLGYESSTSSGNSTSRSVN